MFDHFVFQTQGMPTSPQILGRWTWPPNVLGRSIPAFSSLAEEKQNSGNPAAIQDLDGVLFCKQDMFSLMFFALEKFFLPDDFLGTTTNQVFGIIH